MKKQKPKKNKAKKAVRPVKMKEIYLDYASATPISKAVETKMTAANGLFGNPGALHAKAVEAKNAILEARKSIAKHIDARPEEIVFTGSATESNTLALYGAVEAWRMRFPDETPQIIISAIEHPSIIEMGKRLEEEGVTVTKVAVDAYGVIDLGALKAALTPHTVLVSVMYANNEIGTIEPIESIAKIVRHYRKQHDAQSPSEYPLLHVDATQAFQYMPIRISKPEVDLMTLSSGKIYGPRGIALLFVRNNIPFTPLMVGGGQEMGRRGGTEATQLIIGFAAAIDEAVKVRTKESARLKKIRDTSIRELAKKIPQAMLLGHPTNRLPNNMCFSIPGIESDYLVLALSAKKIYASSRSACKSDTTDEKEIDSHVIMAIGGDPTDGTIRLSFGRGTTEQQVKAAIAILSAAVEKWNVWAHAHKK